MNNAFERMKSLLEKTGLSFNEGGISCAELYAYSRGLELIKNSLDLTESIVFMNCDDTELLARYADMLKIDRERFTLSELKAEIAKRLSAKYAQCSLSQADEAFSLVASGSYLFSTYEVELEGVRLEDLYEASKFLHAYTPYFSNWKYAGTGERLTFDMRESLGYRFNDFDKFKLKFDFLDSIRSDIFE